MTSTRVTLALLVLICAAPVVASWLLLAKPEWRPSGRAHHGQLVQPAQPWGDRVLGTTPAGAALRAGDLRDRWTLLLAAGGCDDDACRRGLWQMRQVRLALGADRERVERVLLLGRQPAPALRRLLGDEYPGMRVALTDPATLAGIGGGSGAPGLALLDPMGNLMMRYTNDTPPADLLADLERLLKLSENWRSHVRDH